jgi:hypothetical protein
MPSTRVFVTGLLGCFLGGATSAAAQSTNETSSSSLPISIERIREALGREPLITAEEILAAEPTFRVLIEEQPFRWQPLFTPAEVSVGVRPPGPASHYEFLRMFSPELTRPYAAFNQNDLLRISIQTLATTLAVRGGTAGVRAAWKGVEKRRLEELRRQIAEEIAVIEARRQN